METTVPSPPNPFGARNGADLYCGQFDHESEDFGPETDVDMVDDVLLSPAIAAAKKLVQGKGLEDDLERQRQQLSDFDDPTDVDRSRDTPTPPAHEVASNATVDPLGDSGEESEDEWNYVPGKDPKPSTTEEEDDMSSQLNPNAAEFVPVSPTRLLMLDDAIISASGYEKSLDNVQLPSELEFSSEIKHRPADLEFTNGHKRVDDYFMRDNFSTLRNKGKDFNVSSTCAEFGDSSILSFKTSSDTSMTECISENIPFDTLEAVKNFEDDKENMLDTNNDLSNNSYETKNPFGKGDPMTTSVMGFTSSPEPENEDSAFPGTPKSTTVEAPVSPFTEDVSPLNLQTDLEPHKDDLMVNEHMKPAGDAQEKASSLGFGSESETEEVAHEDNEGYVMEHRRSPPMDLCFKPIQTFSDSNPFGALQTPSTNTPMDQQGVDSVPIENHKVLDETSKAEEVITSSADMSMFDVSAKSPTSFISLRSPTKEDQIPFDELESPKDELHFEPLPNANSSMIQAEVPKSTEPEKLIEEPTTVETEPVQESCNTFEDLDTTAGFTELESKILLDEQEHEQVSKIIEELVVESSEPTELLENGIECPSKNETLVENVLAAFDDIKDEFESHEEKKKLDLEVETKEMKLEFESHIAPLDISPDDLKNIDEGFEVISKEDLDTNMSDLNSPTELKLPTAAENMDLPSPTSQTNPFATDDDFSANLLEAQNETKCDFISAIENFGSALENDLITPEQSTLLTSSAEIAPSIEPEAKKTYSYQTLTPADEPKLSKTEAYVTGVDENSIENSSVVAENLDDKTQVFVDNFVEKSQMVEDNFVDLSSVPEEPKTTVLDEPVLVKSEPVESQVVTETLITALEEKSEVQSLATTEAPSSAGTPPPTPAPGLEGKDDTQKADILVAAVAAAGAVAAGTAVVAEKEAKKTSTVSTKKPAAATTKKLDTAAKAPAKAVPAKAPAAKPAPTKTTTKPAALTTKPATAASKPAAPKPASTLAAAKKPSPATATLKPSAAKPTTTATSKPAVTSSPKPAVSAAKQVPKQLPVNKTSTLTAKPASKPTTPTSKPTTPTTPKFLSVLKTDVKSPPRPAVKSTLAAKAMSPKPTEKKPLTNGDIKPLAKKTEDVAKKPLAATKPTTTRPASAPVSKTTVPPSKAAPSAVNKTAPTKPSQTTQPKPKTTTAATATAAAKPAVPPPIRRPTSAAVTKSSEKTGKETANKLISNTKPAVNGKTSPAKPAAATKKTDVKMNGKNVPVKIVPKKAEEAKKEEENEIKIQEDNVTTTNGFAEHIIEENGSMKFEELTPVILDGVN